MYAENSDCWLQLQKYLVTDFLGAARKEVFIKCQRSRFIAFLYTVNYGVEDCFKQKTVSNTRLLPKFKN